MTDSVNEQIAKHPFTEEALEENAEPVAIRLAQGLHGAIWTRLTEAQRDVWRARSRRALATLNLPLEDA